MSAGVIDSRIDQQPVWYMLPSASLAEVATAWIGFEDWSDALVRDHPRMRRVALRYPSGAVHFGGVLWNDGRDLHDLDRRAEVGQDISADLESGIWTEPQIVRDIVCGKRFVIAGAATGVGIVTPERRSAHGVSYTCPSCGSDRFPGHVEVFDHG